MLIHPPICPLSLRAKEDKHLTIEDPSLPWPPPDPERMSGRVQARTTAQQREAFTFRDEHLSPTDQLAAFRRRQQQDLERWQKRKEGERRGRVYEIDDEDEERSEHGDGVGGGVGEVRIDEEGSWRNAEGERLNDFGVDEDAEMDILGDGQVGGGEQFGDRVIRRNGYLVRNHD